MNLYKNIVSFILSVILIISLIFSVFFIFYNKTLMNENFYISIINDNNMAQNCYDEIQSNLNYQLTVNNVKPGYVGEVITVDQVSEELKTNITNVIEYFTGKRDDIPNVDASKYMGQVKLGLEKYVKDNNSTITGETTNAIANIEQNDSNIINNQIQIFNFNQLFTFNSVLNTRNIMVKLNNSGFMLILFGIDLIIAIILALLWRKTIQKGLSWIGFSSLTAGLLITAVFLSGFISKFYNNIALNDGYVKEFIAAVIQKDLQILSSYGIVLIAVGLILMSFNWIHLYKISEK